MRVLVTGATGTVGSAVLQRLLEDGHDAVAAVRRPSTSGVLGAEQVRFDFADPATHRPALEGADGLFLMRPPQISDASVINAVVDAAEASGVGRIAFLSVLGAGQNPLIPHRKIEKRLEKSPADVALLRAAYFMQNFSDVHAGEIRRGVLALPAGTGETSLVDARDVGDVAAVWLASGASGHRALDLTGPEALDMFEVARILSEVTGRRVDYRRPGAVSFVRRQRREGAAWPFALVMAGIYTATRLGLADRVTDTVERVLRTPPRSLREFAEDMRGVWA